MTNIPPMSLDEFPKPEEADCNVSIKTTPETISKILQRCEDLGWLWKCGKKPTKLVPFENCILHFGEVNKTKRCIALLQSPHFFEEFFIEDGRRIYSLAEVAVPELDLKILNTQSGRTECAKCGGLLKNPVPGFANMQYCPVCEP